MKAYLLEKDMGNGFVPFELMVKNIDNNTDISLLEITDNGLSVKEYPDVLITDYNDWDERLGVDFDIRDFDPHDVHKSIGITNDDFRHPYVISEVEISGELSDKCKEFLANVDGTITIEAWQEANEYAQFDANGKELKVGQTVVWTDPDGGEQHTKIITAIYGDIIVLDYGTEVYGSECEIIND